jgi:hypothetical protein
MAASPSIVGGRPTASNDTDLNFAPHALPRPAHDRRPARLKGLGKLRYVVEQTIALLHQFCRLANSFVSLACALICRRRLIKSRQHRSCQQL